MSSQVLITLVIWSVSYLIKGEERLSMQHINKGNNTESLHLRDHEISQVLED